MKQAKITEVIEALSQFRPTSQPVGAAAARMGGCWARALDMRKVLAPNDFNDLARSPSACWLSKADTKPWPAPSNGNSHAQISPTYSKARDTNRHTAPAEFLPAEQFVPTQARELVTDGAPSPATAAFRPFLRIADLWKLTIDEQLLLPGQPARPSSTYFKWKKQGVAQLPPDTLDRLSYVLGI